MLHDMIYNSGDFFLPKRVKKILDTDLIGTHTKKHLYFGMVNRSYDYWYNYELYVFVFQV